MGTGAREMKNKINALSYLLSSSAVKRGVAAYALEHGSFDGLEEAPYCTREVREEARRIESEGVFCTDQYTYLTIVDPRYPAQLRTIPDPPLGIFVRGHIPEDWPRMIGVVGSRNCDRDGIVYAREFSKKVALHAPVVSGLALGIDGAAHRGALEGGGSFPTIAVIANGVDRFYPASHHSLAQEILDAGGAIISEYAPGTPAYPSQFLERNRIIAGLCSSLLVVQAAQRSGALVTARLAVEYGRDLFAIPWSLSNARGQGCNKLLHDGAHVVLGEAEFLSQLGIDRVIVRQAQQQLSREEIALVELIQRDGTVHLDEVRRTLGEGVDLILLNLELSKIVERIPGNYLTLGSG